MSGQQYELVVGDGFARDLMRIAADARADPSKVFLRQQVLKEMRELASGKSNGYHALGYEAGKGDLRDCVTSYVQSDGQKQADHRLVFREMPPAGPGLPPRRELLAIKPRHGSNGIYAHVCARLNRHANDRQPGLNAFGDRPAGSGGNEKQRHEELDAKRLVAHTYAGQVPLATSRPLDPAAFGARGSGSQPTSPSKGTGKHL